MALEFDKTNECWRTVADPGNVFTVSYKRGFLPIVDPVCDLGEAYAAVEGLMKDMPALLRAAEFRGSVRERLPQLFDQVKAETDPVLVAQLYRDYCFMSSCYVLENTDYTFQEAKRNGDTAEYGMAEAVLPANLAVPLCHVAGVLGVQPWLDYAYSYALWNWRQRDPAHGFDPANIDLLRSPTGPCEDERGFTAVHVAMESHTGTMVRLVDTMLKAVDEDDRSLFNKSLESLAATVAAINADRERMWQQSKPEAYLDFRTWIMGIKGNTEGDDSRGIFPREGLLFEGVDPVPRQYRGETGAQSTIVPLLDVLLGIDAMYPDNDLTSYLYDLRAYRPRNHVLYLDMIKEKVGHANMINYMHQDDDTMFLLLQVLTEVQDFRSGHWQFARRYIMDHHSYPRATGGTPMATWLPNQLSATVKRMIQVHDQLSEQARELLPQRVTDIIKVEVAPAAA